MKPPNLTKEDMDILEKETKILLTDILTKGCEVCGSALVEFSSNIEVNSYEYAINKCWFLDVECMGCNNKYIHVMEMKTDDRNEDDTTDPNNREDRNRED
tara:strand:+ start:1544 stop:1843 length:300 start_codon:yes stop_codon:yes gene_type:complete